MRGGLNINYAKPGDFGRIPDFLQQVGVWSLPANSGNSSSNMKTEVSKNIDEYIAIFPPGVQKSLQRIRSIIGDAAPDAEETIKYRMPSCCGSSRRAERAIGPEFSSETMTIHPTTFRTISVATKNNVPTRPGAATSVVAIPIPVQSGC